MGIVIVTMGVVSDLAIVIIALISVIAYKRGLCKLDQLIPDKVKLEDLVEGYDKWGTSKVIEEHMYEADKRDKSNAERVEDPFSFRLEYELKRANLMTMINRYAKQNEITPEKALNLVKNRYYGRGE